MILSSRFPAVSGVILFFKITIDWKVTEMFQSTERSLNCDWSVTDINISRHHSATIQSIFCREIFSLNIYTDKVDNIWHLISFYIFVRRSSRYYFQ